MTTLASYGSPKLFFQRIKKLASDLPTPPTSWVALSAAET